MADRELTHTDEAGKARMVDVSPKGDTVRVARAYGDVKMKRSTLDLVRSNSMKKGDVLAVARIAGIMAAKQTSNLIPLCHPLLLTSVKVDFEIRDEESKIAIFSEVSVTGKTGVEMEALQAVSSAALAIFDMCKAVEHTMEIGSIAVLSKEGGKSGNWKNENIL